MCNIDNQPGIIEEAMFRVDPTRIMFLQTDNFDLHPLISLFLKTNFLLFFLSISQIMVVDLTIENSTMAIYLARFEREKYHNRLTN